MFDEMKARWRNVHILQHYRFKWVSRQERAQVVLSWLCRKGNESLERHQAIADSLGAIKQQEEEFEKFYFLAMRRQGKCRRWQRLWTSSDFRIAEITGKISVAVPKKRLKIIAKSVGISSAISQWILTSGAHKGGPGDVDAPQSP
ncbi:hypothetical protein TNCV_5019621 [Trichonephila clavipes]|nr:hypothetical protein TNCV_5019621 [Trichonephila clavipes]